MKREYLKPLTIIRMQTQPISEHTCRECRKFRTNECSWKGVLATDPICDQFQPKTGRRGRRGRHGGARGAKRRKEWKLDLYAEVPQTTKPCGFYGDKLTEAVWLPYKDQNGNVTVRPSLIIATKGKNYKIVDFWNGKHTVKGTFPSRELQSLMQAQSVQLLESKADINPKEIDDSLNNLFKKHLDMPKAETILAKRWIEGTFFYDCFDAFPIESILGVSESGKSRLCLLNLALCYHAEGLIDPTEATIFRSKEEDKVSLIVDEAEYLNNPQLYHTLRILINASYSKYSGYVSRYDEVNGRRVKKRFDLYSPMCISGIGGLEGVTLSRAFRIVMRRVNRDFPKVNPNSYPTLRNMLYTLRIRHAFKIRELYKKTDISNIVTARFEELFKPFFTLTEFMGTPEEHEILAEWCSEYQQNFRTEALNVAQEEMLLLCLTKIEPDQPDWYSLKKITYAFNMEYSKQVSNRYVSNILHRLGIIKRKKLHGYTLIYAPDDLIKDAANRIGVSLSEAPPSHLSPPTPLNWKELTTKKQ